MAREMGLHVETNAGVKTGPGGEIKIAKIYHIFKRGQDSLSRIMNSLSFRLAGGFGCN